jgi:integrase
VSSPLKISVARIQEERAEKPRYERQVVLLRQPDVERAVRYSNSHHICGRIAEWRDEKTVGLTLRITPGQAVWYIRRRNLTLRIGSTQQIGLEKARYIAEQTHLASKRKKRNLRLFFKTLLQLETENGYADPWSWKTADEIASPNSKFGYNSPWKWTTLREEFLKQKKPDLKETYQEQYARYLDFDAFEAINERLVCELTIDDLANVRDQILKDHSLSVAKRSVQQTKEMLNWAWEYQRAKSGLTKYQYEWWLHGWSVKYKPQIRLHTPTINEIARTLVLAERDLNRTKSEDPTYTSSIGALWGTALTAQRTGALCCLRRDRLFDVDDISFDLRGWKTANWTAEEMKGGKDGGRPHSLPIPPEALEQLERFNRKAGAKSPWMFPGKDPEKSVSPTSINHLIYRLQGRTIDHPRKPDRPGKPGPKGARNDLRRVNLFERFGIEPWTPHDVRRTLTTFLGDHGLGGAAAAILAHKMSDQRVPERARLARVTELHYDRSQKIELKSEGMKLWTEALLAACKEEIRRVDAIKADLSP